MIYRLEDARKFCAAQIDGGREWFDGKCVERLNEAEMILMNEVKSIDLRRVAKFYVDEGRTFALPEMIESVLRINLNGMPGYVRGMGYEFMTSGLGEEMDFQGNNAMTDLKDLGDHYPTFYPIGAVPHRLIALSDDKRDYGNVMTIMGFDEKNIPVNAGQGEKLRIGLWNNCVVGSLDAPTLMLTQTKFQQVMGVIKPVTYGTISFYGYDPATHNLIFLSRYLQHIQCWSIIFIISNYIELVSVDRSS
jgi:hypothetical protein